MAEKKEAERTQMADVEIEVDKRYNRFMLDLVPY